MLELNTKLTPHFKLGEFTRSMTAQLEGLDNTPPDAAIVNLINLCIRVLEPLRLYADRAVDISSGYRSPAVNAAVGGVKTSQHMQGEAADIHLPSREIGDDWFNWIATHCNFDQLIMEHDKQGNRWIHVSCKLDTKLNRQRIIRNLLKT